MAAQNSIFSAKESLALRDHEEFATVLDSLKIKHSYITSKSPASLYVDIIKSKGITFQTVDDLSLYISSQISGRRSPRITSESEDGVAFLDECDSILKFDKTQFNYYEQQIDTILILTTIVGL